MEVCKENFINDCLSFLDDYYEILDKEYDEFEKRYVPKISGDENTVSKLDMYHGALLMADMLCKKYFRESLYYNTTEEKHCSFKLIK